MTRADVLDKILEVHRKMTESSPMPETVMSSIGQLECSLNKLKSSLSSEKREPNVEVAVWILIAAIAMRALTDCYRKGQVEP